MAPGIPVILSDLNMVWSTSSNANTSRHRIFVRNLPPNTSEEMLRAYFNQMGSVVDASIFLDPYGAPLDVAMVAVCDECTADFFEQRRFHDFHGARIETVELLSTESALAREQFDARTIGDVSRDARNGNNLHPGNLHGIRPPRGISKDTIVVLNLQPKITKEVLQTYFNQFGVVKSVALARKGNKKRMLQRFHGFVTFMFEENVRNALLLDDEDDEDDEENFHEIHGVKVQVKRAWD